MAIVNIKVPQCDVCGEFWLPEKGLARDDPRKFDRERRAAGEPPLRCGKCKSFGWDRNYTGDRRRKKPKQYAKEHPPTKQLARQIQASQVELEPETKQALHGQSPQGAWFQVENQVAGAVEEEYRFAEEVRQDTGYPRDLVHLQAVLGQMQPEDGLNLLLSVRPHMDLSKIAQMNPLTVLRGVLEIFTKSDDLARREL